MQYQLKRCDVSCRTKADQRIVITYNDETKTTTIDCDMDVVSVGIAVEVLLQLYEEALSGLDKELVADIRMTIKEALQ